MGTLWNKPHGEAKGEWGTMTNHGFKKGLSWLICHFLLLDMYILTKVKGLNNTCILILMVNLTRYI